MNPLDDIEHILGLDRSQMHKSIKDFPIQLDEAWNEAQSIDLSDNLDITNIVIAGMGDACLGADTIYALYLSKIIKPVTFVNGYHLPGFASKDTLVILLSNSGNTEEIMSIAYEAKERRCKIAGITAGGQLKDFLISNNFSAYIYDEKLNPTKQGRLALGNLLMGTLAILANSNLLNIERHTIQDSIRFIMTEEQAYGIEIETEKNIAKQIAEKLWQSIPFIISSDFLAGSAKTLSYLINENAKKLSASFVLPELNHHLLEGLGYEQNKNEITFLLFESNLYPQRIQKRLELTKTIIEKNNYKAISLEAKGHTQLAQALNLIQLSAYVSYYLAIKSNIDPTPVPWATFLQKELDI